jgi:hypothetical protein
MRKLSVSLLLVFGCLMAIFTFALAQTSEYTINLHRTFGYSSGNQVRGSFSLDVVPTTNVKSVTYRIDDQVMQKVETSPFSYSFQTSQYPTGMHQLSALVETTDGRTVSTPVRQFEFATADQESSSVVKIVFPVLGGLVLLMVLIIGSQFLFFKNRPSIQMELGAPRNYGLNGGGVCPRCHRPYPLHWWAVNAGLGTKFDRCDFCGKWAFVRRLSKAELVTAENNEKQMAKPETPIAEKSEDERLREMVDKSRYTS